MDNNNFSSYYNLLNDILDNKNIIKNNDIKLNSVFKECIFNDLKLKNHFYFYNLTDNFLFDNFGNPTEKFIEFYNEIAKSDVSLIFTGGIYVGLNKNNAIKKYPVIKNDKASFDIFTKTISNIHRYGTKIFLTIKSIYGRADNENKFLKIFSYSASNNKSYNEANLPCVRLSDNKCYQIVEEYKNASKMAINLGFDGVLIDGNLFSIAGEFSSYEFNRRKFGYFSELIDFPFKIISSIVTEIKNINLVYNITLSSFIEVVYDKNIKEINTIKNIKINKNGFNLFKFLTQLVNFGVDAFIFEFGTYETEFFKTFNQFQKENLFENFVKEIKQFFENTSLKTKFDLPVKILIKDNYNDLRLCEKLLNNNLIDIFDVTKNIYSDSRFLLNEKTQKISKNCIKCSFCDQISKKNGKIECAINPELINKILLFSSDNKTKKVAIIGAGLSGIICAITLARRGFCVDIYERNNKINSSSRRCEIFGYDKLLNNYNNYLENEVHSFHENITLLLNKNFDVNSYDLKKYCSIVVASGFHEKFLNITGAILKNVKSIFDCLDSYKIFEKKEHIVINAKSELSFKLALYLLNQNKKISIIIESMDFLKNMPNDRLTYYLFAFKKLKAKVYPFSKVKYIQEDFIEIFVNNKLKNKNFQSLILNYISGSNYSFEAKAKTIDCDLFIYEPDIYPNNKIYYELVKNGYNGQLFLIGNALEICDMATIIQSGYFVGKNL